MSSESTMPDQLLKSIQQSHRGKLRIYFGAVAGVGKTYSMLKAAKQAQSNGVKVLVGWVETHHREETEAQLAGLTVLPPHTILFKEKTFSEFDLDMALSEKPELLLLDELAHSNIQGSRHPKRWQDIEELLNAGIDVWTTLNVQHLESLHDVIGHITGVNMTETIPDTFFYKANEIILIDITASEWLERLRNGQIYDASKITQAQQHFFKKGNLISLREIALRTTAQALESDVKTYRLEKSIQPVWETDAGLLAYITGKSSDDDMIRRTARMAKQLHCEWHVVFIEQPFFKQSSLDSRQKNGIQSLKFAESLGAETALLYGKKVEDLIVEYARQHNLQRIVSAQKGYLSQWLNWRLRVKAPELDLILLSESTIIHHTAQQQTKKEKQRWLTPRTNQHLLIMTLSSLLLSVVLYPFTPSFDNTNIAMLYLLLVISGTMFFGRGVGIFTSVLTVALFDFMFVSPRFSFAVNDMQYIVTLGVMLVVSLTISKLTIYLKHRASIASIREHRAMALFDFAKNLSGVLEKEEILKLSEKYLTQEFPGKVYFILPDEHEKLVCDKEHDILNMPIVQWAYRHEKEAGFSTHTLPDHPILYIPLMAPVRIRGILAIAPAYPDKLLDPEYKRQLDIYISLIALTLERIHFVDVAGKVLTQVETEKVRNTLLAAISHDLRTPLTAMVGQAEYLNMYFDQLDSKHIHESLDALTKSTQDIHQFVSNLLEMVRLESGHLTVQYKKNSIGKVIHDVVAKFKFDQTQSHIKMDVSDDMPDIEFDAVLINQVITNLVENSIKYSEQPADIHIKAFIEENRLKVFVSDYGKGLPSGIDENMLFDKFYRGHHESSIVGSGLGLSIAKLIIDAHGGDIQIVNRTGERTGCIVYFSLPVSHTADPHSSSKVI